MSDPVTNVQIEDVLSSIRRLVSEEIGQQEPLKARAKPVDEEEQKLVLSPAQKIRQDAAERGSDLWKATEEMAPTEAAPVWWHRDSSEFKPEDAVEPMQLGAPLSSESLDVEAPEIESDAPAEEVVEASVVEETQDGEPAGPVLEAQDAPIDIEDDDFEPPEGEIDIDFGVKLEAMPWDGDETTTEYAETSDEPQADDEDPDSPDDAPFTFRPGERLFERLSSKKMTASQLPEVETVESSAVEEDPLSDIDPELQAILEPSAEIVEEPVFEEEAIDDPEDAEENYFNADADSGDLSNIFDEDMLRDLVKDIIRQELQGVLGERITRNVRKLVRREIQRALSDVNKM